MSVVHIVTNSNVVRMSLPLRMHVSLLCVLWLTCTKLNNLTDLLRGCSVDLKDIAMLGKWSNEHIVKSYVNGIPLNAVLGRAGFKNHVHMIPRSTVQAPQELLDLIFPDIEEMLEHKKEVGCCTCTHW